MGESKGYHHVVNYLMHVRLEQFEGPLHVLLALIEEQKLDISTISLARITEEYLALISGNEGISFDDLVYFVDIGSRLIVWKTRLLLPYLTSESNADGDDDASDLVMMLQNYKRFLAASKELQKIYENNEGGVCCSKNMRKRMRIQANLNEESVSLPLLHAAMVRIVQNRAPKESPFAPPLKRLYNIQEKIQEIVSYLNAKQSALFSDLVSHAPNRSEIIAAILALLELAKSRYVVITQVRLFHTIGVATVQSEV